MPHITNNDFSNLHHHSPYANVFPRCYRSLVSPSNIARSIRHTAVITTEAISSSGGIKTSHHHQTLLGLSLRTADIRIRRASGEHCSALPQFGLPLLP